MNDLHARPSPPASPIKTDYNVKDYGLRQDTMGGNPGGDGGVLSPPRFWRGGTQYQMSPPRFRSFTILRLIKTNFKEICNFFLFFYQISIFFYPMSPPLFRSSIFLRRFVD